MHSRYPISPEAAYAAKTRSTEPKKRQALFLAESFETQVRRVSAKPVAVEILRGSRGRNPCTRDLMAPDPEVMLREVEVPRHAVVPCLLDVP
jgi:hypothetical protein